MEGTLIGGGTRKRSSALGREEEEEMAMGRSTSESFLGDGSLANLEFAARDAISRVMANPDVQNVGESIRNGALKVSHKALLCHV